MRLKNKKTGKIIEIVIVDHGDEWEIRNVYTDEGIQTYDSLAKLNEEWEDYEEPKEYWYINDLGKVEKAPSDWLCDERDSRKSIGNYFETREEAELAVRKLKAWKRLKDKGFRFTGINDDENSQELITQCGILCEADIYHLAKYEDFLLLFSGEDD